MTHVGNSDGLGKSRQEINHNNEPHRETTESAKVREENKLDQIVDRGINPSTTLREKNAPFIGCDGVRNSIGREFHLECGEVLHHEGCQVTIFTEREQVLLVERIDNAL